MDSINSNELASGTILSAFRQQPWLAARPVVFLSNCYFSTIYHRAEHMNRRKKIKQLLQAHAKKASAKLAPKRKSAYISKADRLKAEAETTQDLTTTTDN